MRRLLALVALAVLLPGCTIRFDSLVEVDSDGSGTLAIAIGFDDELRALMEQDGGGDLSMTQDLGDVPAGWSVADYTDGEFEGIRASVDFDDFADLDRRLAELEEPSEQDGSTTSLMKPGILSRDGGMFRFSMTVTGLEEDLSGSVGGSQDDDPFAGVNVDDLIGQVFQPRIIVTLPGTITNHNADQVDGNTLVWQIGIADEGRTLTATSQLGGGPAVTTILLIVAAVLLVALLAFGVIAVARRKKGPTVPDPDTGEEAVPIGADPFAS